MQEYISLQAAVEAAYTQLDIDGLQKKVDSLLKETQHEQFWNNTEHAQRVSKELAQLQKRVLFWVQLRTTTNDIVELASMHDASLEEDIAAQFTSAQTQYMNAKKELQLNGPYDTNDALLSIFAGAGGTDAQDWASMLLRMYTRWSEEQGASIQLLDISEGEEAGIKSVTIEITGADFLYGRLQGEHGVHRLVRLSPFNADSLRQTSFARVEVMPKIDSPLDIVIDDKDLKVDVYRSGGKGGQSVNTTDSAVRITHIPTGLVVAIQNERSQLQNRETAMTILRSKLAQLQLEQHKDHIEDIKGPTEQAAWGNQIRNYVLHPYSLVKDVRTKHETSDVQKVLDGDIEAFIDAYLNSVM